MDTTRNRRSFNLNDVPSFKQKMLNWLKPFGIFCYLDNQRYAMAPQQAECLVAAGAVRFVEGNDIDKADAFLAENSWVFGHLAYELMNSLHGLASDKKDKIGFPLFYFFIPQIVLELNGSNVVAYADDAEAVFENINGHSSIADNIRCSVSPQPILSKERYIEKIKALQAHILRGDCYEINFCQEFFAGEAKIDPFAAFRKLMSVSPNPFSAFYRLQDKFLLCASPKRFLLKKGRRLFSQPIKGTTKRDLGSALNDQSLRRALLNSNKDRAENVMIVDLVRNDLTKICREDTVIVDELFGVYSFPQVHQMISTISGELKDGVLFSRIVQATFPMGSMTGAPKRRVMQLIDEYEPSARGLFSGSVGYIKPDGDFDFNVVIRSLLYNETHRHLSYQVGSGITFYSDAEKEWEECMLKAEAIRKVLG